MTCIRRQWHASGDNDNAIRRQWHASGDKDNASGDKDNASGDNDNASETRTMHQETMTMHQETMTCIRRQWQCIRRQGQCHQETMTCIRRQGQCIRRQWQCIRDKDNASGDNDKRFLCCRSSLLIMRRCFTCDVWADLGGSVGSASDWWSGGWGFDPRRVGNILSWWWIMKYFLRSFSPGFWRKDVHSTGSLLWGQSLPSKSMVTLNMTPLGWLDRKTSSQIKYVTFALSLFVPHLSF